MTASAEPEAPAGAALRIPDFYIVGHPKSGTTALYEMLRSHPQIFMPDLKEPRWFAADLRERFQGQGSQAHPQTLEQYAALFARAGAEQLVGEASPSYLRSRVAAAEIARLRPDARIVAVLREPAEFLRSMHLEMVQNRVEDETDMRRAIEHETLMAEPGAEPMLRYGDRVRYVEQLRRYAQRFPPEQMLVLIYDDFRAENEQTVRRVLRFLGVDDGAPIVRVEANPSVRVRSLRLDDAVRALYAGSGPLARAVKATSTALVPERVRSRLFSGLRRRLVYASPQPPDPELMNELRRRFEPEVVALGEYLGRDLVSLWGYDRLG
jgi:hypothetical protein